jgi:hypothetical protein
VLGVHVCVSLCCEEGVVQGGYGMKRVCCEEGVV